MFEPLEDRRLLAVVTWDGGGDGVNWTDAANWSGNVLPGSGDDVQIDIAANPEVTLASGTHAIQSLVSAEAVELSGGTLTVATTVKVSNSFNLAGGALVSATILPGDGGEGVNVTAASTLDGVSLSADMTTAPGVVLTVKNGLSLDGRLTLGVNGLVYFLGPQTLSGSGEVLLGETSNGYLRARGTSSSNPATVTIGAGITVRLGAGAGYLDYHFTGDQFVNLGTIVAGTANSSLYMRTPLTNQGSLNVTDSTLILERNWDNGGGAINSTNSTLNLGGAWTLSDLSTFNIAGGTVGITGTLDNTATTLDLDASSSTWRLKTGGTILGGTVHGSAGEVLYVDGGKLDGVSLSADATVKSAELEVKNGLVLDGTLTVDGTGQLASIVYFTGTQTLSGSGELVYGASSQSRQKVFAGALGSAETLTIGAGILVRGGNGYLQGFDSDDALINQGVVLSQGSSRRLAVYFGQTTNLGTLEATNGALLEVDGLTGSVGNASVFGGGALALVGTFTQDQDLVVDGSQLHLGGTWTNTGTIALANGASLFTYGTWENRGSLNVTDSTLYLQQNWDNSQGTINTTNSELYLAGTWTLSDLTTFNIAGGTVYIAGTLDNTGTTLDLDDISHGWFVAGTIFGGRVHGSAGRVLRGRGVLDGVKLSADVVVDPEMGFRNGLLLDGSTVTVEQDRKAVFWGSQTLSGTGQILLGGHLVAQGTSSSDPATVTIGPGVTVRLGTPYSSLVNWSLDAVQNGDQFVNQGTIIAGQSNRVLRVNAPLTNLGTIESSNNATIEFLQGLTTDGSGRLSSTASGSIVLYGGSLTGNTTNSDNHSLGRIQLSGAGTFANPQFLEVMGKDLGSIGNGFQNNFGHGTIAVDGSYIRLQDLFDNSPGTEPESLYVNSLIVGPSATLDLNGLNLYTRAAKIDGAVVGGSIIQVPDGGTLAFGISASGTIAMPGELDEWSFFGRAGQAFTLHLNPGSVSPAPMSPFLSWAEVTLLSAGGTVLSTASSTSSGAMLALDNIVLPSDGTYRVQVRAPTGNATSTGNYMLSLYNVTVDEFSLNLNRAVTGSIGIPYNLDHWNFSAAAGQQIQFDLLDRSSSKISFKLTGPGGYTAFSGLQTDSDLITLPSPGRYTLEAYESSGETGSYAFKLVETAITEIGLGVVYSSSLVGSGHAHLFKLPLPTGTALKVFLDDEALDHQNELYARFGSPPTRSEFDYRFSAPGEADQELLLPHAMAGDWYILVYGHSVPSPSSFNLLAMAVEIDLASITPTLHGQAAGTVLTLNGLGFDPRTGVSLIAEDSTQYAPTAVTVNSFSEITTTFDLDEVPAGIYSVRVEWPDGTSDTLPGAFTLEPGAFSQLTTNLVVPGALGRHSSATLYVEYANTGNVAMKAPLLVLQSADLVDGSDRPLLTLDAARMVGIWTSGQPDGFGTSVSFLASGAIPGMVQPGESFRVPVYYGGLQLPWSWWDDTVELEIRVFSDTEPTPIDWDIVEASNRPPAMTVEAWDAVVEKLKTQIGATWGDYVRMLDENAAYLGRLGTSVVDVSQLWEFEVRQANAEIGLVGSLAEGVDAAVDVPGLPLLLERTFGQPIASRFETGPFGRGWGTTWQTSLSVDSDGSVSILGPGGARRRFQPDRRNPGYLAAPGDLGTLTFLGSGVYRLREPDGLVIQFASGNLEFVEDTNGNRITAGYVSGKLGSLTHSSGASLTLDYNSAGRIATITDSLARVTSYTYDDANEYLLSVLLPNGDRLEYTYIMAGAANHALSSITFPDRSHRFYTYDALGRVASTSRDGNTELVIFAYDLASGVTVTEAGESSQWFFGIRGELLKVVTGLGESMTFTYDSLGRLVRSMDALSQTSSYVYDSRGNLVRAVDELGNAVHLGFGSLNRLTDVVDARGNALRYAYDARGNLVSTTYANQTLERFTRDPEGNPVFFTDRRGRTIDYTYDAAGRITRQTLPNGTQIDYAYDGHGNLVSATDAAGPTTLEYDSQDRLTKVAYPNGRFVQYAYDGAGRRSRISTHDGHVTDYLYDDAGRLAGLRDGGGGLIVDYIYDAAGRLVREDKGNGTYTTYEYDQAGQLLHLVNHAPDGSVNSRFDYTYVSLGRRIGMGTGYGLWTYLYDSTGQLTRAVLASTDPSIPDQDLEYVYDAAGNRIRTIENGVTTDYATNKLNQYTSVGAASQFYDANGNRISVVDGGETTTYAYDVLNRLVSVISPAGTWTYEYDALGNRVAIVRDGQRMEYLLDPTGLGDAIAEYGGDGALLARYIHGLGLESREGGATTAYYDFDAIGSTAGLSGTGGTYVNQYSYLPFGEDLASTEGIANTFEFVGQFGVMDEGNGLDFMRARFYDPSEGRFTQADPIGIDGGLNLYQYVHNDPVNRIDPLGLEDAFDRQMDLIRRYRMSQGWSRDPRQRPSSKFRTMPDPGEYELPIPLFHPPFQTQGPAKMPFGGGLKTLRGWQAELRDAINWEVERTSNGGDGYMNGPPSPPPTPPEGGSGGARGATAIVASKDPNQKIGAAGVGAEHYVADESLLPYRIDFENDATATAPAQHVLVTDQLSPDLDWSTLEFTEFGFGDYLIQVPAGRQYFFGTIPMTYNGQDFEVQVELAFNPETGRITASFWSIDPISSLPPDALTGFLPPEDGTGRGMGYFSYVVRPDAGLPTGTEIRNIALITFDSQEIVATNQIDPHKPAAGTDPAKEARITIDAGTPDSSVVALPPTTNSLSFPVNWTGNDDSGGSGIASFDVYVAVDDGSFTPWLNGTVATSSNFTGQSLHRYSFYSVARDKVGHLESAPTVADATITISNQAPSFTKGSDQIVNEDAGPQTVLNWATNISAGPTNESAQLLDFLVATDNGALFSTLPTVSAVGALTYTPAPNANGSATVTVRIHDSGGTENNGIDTSAPQTFTINVAPVNDTPFLASPGNNTVDEKTLLTFTLQATDNDVVAGENDTIAYSITNGNQTGMTLDAATGAFSWAPSETQDGQHTVVFRATDTHNAFTEQTITISVSDMNDPPVMANPGNKSLSETANVSFSLSAPDGDVVAGVADTVTFSLVSGSQPGMSLNSTTGVFGWTPNEPQDGQFTVVFRAKDNHDIAGADQTVTITVSEANDPPVLSHPGNKTLDEKTALNFSLTATDSDLIAGVADTVGYSIFSGSLPGMTLNGTTGAFSWMPTEAQDGQHAVVFRATDNHGSAGTDQTVTITVNEVNADPVLSPIGARVVAELATLSFTISATDSDVPAQTLIYNASGMPAGATFDADTRTLSWTPGEDQGPGSYQVTFSVSDGMASDSETVTITVTVTAPWQFGPKEPQMFDTNGSGTVEPQDVLRVINQLNDPTILRPGNLLPDSRPADSTLPFYDVNGDGFCTPVGDVLPIINFLNERSAEGEDVGAVDGEFSIDDLILPLFERSSATVVNDGTARKPQPADLVSARIIYPTSTEDQDNQRTAPASETEYDDELEGILDEIVDDVLLGQWRCFE